MPIAAIAAVAAAKSGSQTATGKAGLVVSSSITGFLLLAGGICCVVRAVRVYKRKKAVWRGERTWAGMELGIIG